MYEVGDKVIFCGNCQHKPNLGIYPKMGTLGRVVRAEGNIVKVQWPIGSTSLDDCWWYHIDFLKPVPKIIILCGSTKFKIEFEEANKELTLQGYIVLSVGLFGHADGEYQTTITPEVKTMLDDLHKRKIDISDEIYVINRDGYIGESTKSEIEYAEQCGKKVVYRYATKPKPENTVDNAPPFDIGDKVVCVFEGLPFCAVGTVGRVSKAWKGICGWKVWVDFTNGSWIETDANKWAKVL